MVLIDSDYVWGISLPSLSLPSLSLPPFHLLSIPSLLQHFLPLPLFPPSLPPSLLPPSLQPSHISTVVTHDYPMSGLFSCLPLFPWLLLWLLPLNMSVVPSLLPSCWWLPPSVPLSAGLPSCPLPLSIPHTHQEDFSAVTSNVNIVCQCNAWWRHLPAWHVISGGTINRDADSLCYIGKACQLRALGCVEGSLVGSWPFWTITTYVGSVHFRVCVYASCEHARFHAWLIPAAVCCRALVVSTWNCKMF